MIHLSVKFDDENPWPDLADQKKLHFLRTGQIQIAVLDKGMQSGKPSIVVRIDLPDGTIVAAETSARLFCGAGRAITAKYPDLFEDK